MPTFADNLARLRVSAATGTIAPDVARWALEVIGEQGEAAARMERRNELLRAAVAGLSGSRWAKARRLEGEIRALGVRPALRERAADDGVRELVAEALEVAPAPESIRHLFRILGD